MRILIAHNTYQHAGGEDTVVANEQELLESAGHEVLLHTVSNDDINGFRDRLSTFSSVHYSHAAKRGFAIAIAKFKPDIVHVHNFFPLLTPSIYDACIEAKVPVVQTLHNFRTICSGALLMRDGKVCEKCLGGSVWWGVAHRCYRNSLPGSLALARMINFHQKRKTWHKKVSQFIALTDFARNKFTEAGVLSENISIKPNFVPDLNHLRSKNPRSGALFVGRISGEKGVDILIKAWQEISYQLRIAGGGALLEAIQADAPNNVSFLGQLSNDDVHSEMLNAAFLVMPSTWYEMFPMVLAESFSLGLPAIVSALGSMAEIVNDGVTGLHFNPKDADDLAAKIRWAIEHPDEMAQMGKNARTEYEHKYTPDENYRQLISIYEKAIASNAIL